MVDRPWYRQFFGGEGEALARDAEAAKEALRDVQSAGPFIRTFKERLQRLAGQTKWKPGMGQEEAAQNLIAQTVYLEVIQELDRMMRAATEHVNE